jgi:hypothetical protein
MFITGILVLIWIRLFDKSYTLIFSILFLAVFMIEICIDLISISSYLSLPRFRINNNRLIQCSFKSIINHFINRTNPPLISNIRLENPFRRLMLLRIQNLFQMTMSNDDSNHHNNSLFDYRCPICLNYKENSFRWIALGCGHILCSFCLQEVYFGNKPLCPNCRTPIFLSDLTILYI